MYKFLLLLHLVFAVFAVGPLVHAATTAGRGIRKGDGAATASSARLLKIYGYASVLVIATGLILMRTDPRTASRTRYADYLPSSDGVFYGGGSVRAGELSQTWIWLSLVLWVVAVGLVLGLIVPTLEKATALLGEEKSVVSMTARVAATGGVVGLLFVAIVVLMVYRPGR